MASRVHVVHDTFYTCLCLLVFLQSASSQLTWETTPYRHYGHLRPWCRYRSLMNLPQYDAAPYRPWGNNDYQGGYPAPREGFVNNVWAQNLQTGQRSPCQPGQVFVYRPRTIDFDATPSVCPSGPLYRFLPCHCERGCRHKHFFIPHDVAVIVDKCGNKCSCRVDRPAEAECEFDSC